MTLVAAFLEQRFDSLGVESLFTRLGLCGMNTRAKAAENDGCCDEGFPRWGHGARLLSEGFGKLPFYQEEEQIASLSNAWFEQYMYAV